MVRNHYWEFMYHIFIVLEIERVQKRKKKKRKNKMDILFLETQ